MPTGLRRYQTQGHDHLITFSCYHRLPYLEDSNSKSTLEHILEETRAKYSFEIHAYVVMPEHVHLLISEPDGTCLAKAINVLKFRTSKQLKGDRKQFWQTRYHDANILTHRRWLNALRYIHNNPVKRGLVLEPEHYRWSSARHWLTAEPGSVRITTRWPTLCEHVSPEQAGIKTQASSKIREPQKSPSNTRVGICPTLISS